MIAAESLSETVTQQCGEYSRPGRHGDDHAAAVALLRRTGVVLTARRVRLLPIIYRVESALL